MFRTLMNFSSPVHRHVYKTFPTILMLLPVQLFFTAAQAHPVNKNTKLSQLSGLHFASHVLIVFYAKSRLNFLQSQIQSFHCRKPQEDIPVTFDN
jgi:hypothetical protein